MPNSERRSREKYDSASLVQPPSSLLSEAHFFARRFDEAAANLLASLELAPTFPVTYRVLASCYVHMGRLDDAREIVRRLRAINGNCAPL
jgi:pentatricopeptide repeat protein